MVGIETLYNAKLHRLETAEAGGIRATFRDWQRTLPAKEAKQKSRDQLALYVARFIDHYPPLERISELTPARVRTVLGQYKLYGPAALKRGKRGPSSHKTLNMMLAAVQQFSAWLHEDGRALEDRLQYVRGYRLSTDRRHDRADLTGLADRLLEAAYHGGPVRGLSGRQRFWLYYTAINTGLRADEIRRLTPRHCRLTETPPLIRFGGNENKGGRAVAIVLRRDYAADLAGYMSPKSLAPESAVFDFLHPNTKYAALVYADLASLGLSRTDADGLYRDFHALRHTYSSRLGATGADIKTLQTLMRHTDPKLTMRYTHADRAREVAAVEALAPIGRELAQLARIYPHGDLNPGHLAENQTATDTCGKVARPIDDISPIIAEATKLPTAALRMLVSTLSEHLRGRIERQ